MRKIFLFTLLIYSSSSFLVYAKNDAYKLCNHHKFTFFMLKIYDIYLCTNETKNLSPEKIFNSDFALKIEYNMSFNKEKLAQSSIKEIKRYYKINKATENKYYQSLITIFPNVETGDIINTEYNLPGEISFYHNGLEVGEITDPKFAREFLDIWLHRNNKYKKMSIELFDEQN